MMEADLQRRIQRYGWDKAAHYYENFWQRQLKPAQDKLLEMAGIEAGEKIIDVACGTGLVSFEAAIKTGIDGFLLGTDISGNMIALCRESATGQSGVNIQFERMDAEDLDLGANEFDLALCSLGLMYVPDPLQALREIYRVLKRGGRAVVSVWGKRENCGWAEIFEIVDRRVASEVCPLFFNLGNADLLERNFTAAGFSNIAVDRLKVKLEYDSGQEACGAAFDGGPVALAYHKFSETVKQEVHSEYLHSIKPYQQLNGYAIPGEFVIARGFK